MGQLLRRYESLKDYGRSAYSAFDLAQGHLLHKEDKVFLDRMLEIIHGNILDTSLSTQFIADRMGMSLPNFYRRLGRDRSNPGLHHPGIPARSGRTAAGDHPAVDRRDHLQIGFLES